MNEEVNSPSHYKTFPDMEAFDVIRNTLTDDELRGYLKGNVLKYRLRAGEKGPPEKCIAKANWYRDKLRELAGEAAAANDNASARPLFPHDGSPVEFFAQGAGRMIVPPGYSWVAQDVNGHWWAYEGEPVLIRSVWEPQGGRYTHIGSAAANDNWHTTLRQVRP